MCALAAALAPGGSRDAFKLTRKSLIPKIGRKLLATRISERISFTLNFPHGWKFSGKVSIGTVVREHVLSNQHLNSSTGFLEEI
jgi:hypothetical protein